VDVGSMDVPTFVMVLDERPSVSIPEADYATLGRISRPHGVRVGPGPAGALMIGWNRGRPA
jgi:hypothetical protein